MPASALPPHLQKNGSRAIGRGTDWDNWLQAYIPEGWFAFGPNAKPGWTILPLLVLPYKFGRYEKPPWFRPTGWFRIGIPIRSRWRGVPKLLAGFGVTRWMTRKDADILFVNSLYGKWTGAWIPWGRNGKFQVTGKTGANEEADFVETLEGFGPSPIQYWSPVGFALTWPLHIAIWAQWDFDPNEKDDRKKYKKIAYFRAGARWDSFDDYTDAPTLFIGGTFN